jgi:CRP-like cAMP-binding protein
MVPGPHEHPSAESLAAVPLFADLPLETREVLAGRFEVQGFGVGQRLVAEGRRAFSFYVLASGEASVEHDGRTVRTLGAGDFFGEIAILGSERRTATVSATRPGTAWTLLGTHFHELRAERPDVAQALERAMRERLGDDTADDAADDAADDDLDDR